MKSKNARLIDNNKLMQNVILRANIIRLIRAFFDDEGFLEVDTPLLDLCPSMEPAITSFSTSYNNGADKRKMYLQSSPEYNMKKLLSSGYDKIFQVTKSFRNNELTRLHNPEFTILEWYRCGSDYYTIMDDVEKLILHIARGLGLIDEIKYLNNRFDLSKPYDRLYIKDAFKQYSKIDLDRVRAEDYYDVLTNRGLSIKREEADFNTFFYFIFVNEIEPHLAKKRPLFLIDYPERLGSLARRKDDDPGYVERFELYIGGLELCNAFSELTGHSEQKERFLREKRKRAEDDLEDYPIDNDFLQFLEYGMPESTGVALGVDRLVMLFADTDNIDDVLLFPFSMMADFKQSV